MLSDIQRRQFVRENILFSYKKPTGGEIYTPTFILGLGGTGLKVLRYLKKHVRRNEGQDLEFLGIDTDLKENGKWPELPKLADSELLVLDPSVAVGQLAQAAKYPDQHKFLLDYLPSTHAGHANIHTEVSSRIRTSAGAGQFRRAGRLIFNANAIGGSNVRSAFVRVREKLVGITETQQKLQGGQQIDKQTRIFVIGSLAGGTGAGSLLDCLALLRTVFNGPTDQITVFGVLPGEFLDRELNDPAREKGQTRANAVALLQELQAALTGKLSNYEFRFDEHTRFTPSIRGLLDGCYLIDNRLYNGIDPKSFMDICNAVALFIYSFVGTGLGAEQASGEINSAIAQAADAGGPLCCFRGLGVAALAYPIDDLEEYSLRYVLDLWMERWLSAETDPEALALTVSNAETALKLNDPESFAMQFRQVELSGWEFAATKADESKLLGEDDDAFLNARFQTLAEFERNLRAHRRQIEEMSGVVVAENRRYVQDLARQLAGTSSAYAVNIIEQLLAKAREVQQALSTDKTTRQDEVNNIKKKLPSRERWIKVLDFGLDRLFGNRQAYIKAVKRLFQLEYFGAFDGEIDESVGALVEELNRLLTELKNLKSSIERDFDQNRKTLADMDGSDPADESLNQYGVVQQAIPCSQFRQWTQQVQVNWPDNFTPDRLDKDALIETVWKTMAEPFREALEKLDLIAEAKREWKEAEESGETTSGSLINRIKALDSSAVPSIKLVDHAPLPQDMAPQKYVAGIEVRTTNRDVLGHFTAPAGGTGKTVSALSISSPHILLCAQTFKGFAAAHWEGFDVALRYYNLDPWRAHALPDWVKLDSLEPLTSRETATLQALGLALVGELIIEQGNAFHFNYDSNGTEYCYVTFRRERGAAAKKLVESKLVSEAPETALDPRGDGRLGSTLEECLRGLGTPESLHHHERISKLVDRARNQHGDKWLKQVIEEFTGKTLGSKIAAQSAERTVRERLKIVLTEYAGRL